MSVVTLNTVSEAPPLRAAKIQDVINALRLPEGRLAEPDLERVVAAFTLRPELFSDLVADGTEGRWWTLLFRSASFELRLLTWSEAEESDWHDHGGSSGVYAVAKGELVERYRSSDAVSIETRTLNAGQRSTFGPQHVHDVAFGDGEPTVSIHAYSPPLSGMTYYDQTEFGFVAKEFVPESRRDLGQS